jgi:rhamnogalacturonyl hydrolase YesR
MKDIKRTLNKSIQKVEKWVEDHDYKGYEPFDGLLSYLRPLTFGSLFLDRILMQLVRQSPINLRPMLGVKPQDSTIGRGYMASGYLIMYKITNEEIYKEKAGLCLEWLMKNRSPGYKNFCWGKHFDYASRGGRYQKLEPITIWTSLIGQAFLDGYEVIGKREYLDVATSICDWIMELPRNKTDSGSSLGYTTKGISSIHNSNMHGAAMLARTAAYMENTAYFTVAKEAMEFSCVRQLSNGAWYYGEAPNNHWIDNFHTGYNLDGLKLFIEYSSDKEFEDNLKRGISFYKDTFFEENGRPKYYHNRTYPVDIQCASQSIETLANFSDYDESSLPLALKVAKWTIDNMQDERGYFYYRQYPLMKAKAPMIHWAQGTMYKALAALLSKVGR